MCFHAWPQTLQASIASKHRLRIIVAHTLLPLKPFISYPQSNASAFPCDKPLMKAGRLNEQIISFKNRSWHESTTNAFLIAFALTSLANTYPCCQWNHSGITALSVCSSGVWGNRGSGLRTGATAQSPLAVTVLSLPSGHPKSSRAGRLPHGLWDTYKNGLFWTRALKNQGHKISIEFWGYTKDEHNEGELEISFVPP